MFAIYCLPFIARLGRCHRPSPAIVHHPDVLDAVEDLIGPDILCYHLTMPIKEPGSDAIILWRQDDDYFQLTPAEHVTA
ncbi:MAG: hypothetical protein GKR94_04845 [Gammaproteobacteria bacterium]|nr:hypothetical protein [Gammaproteobacteria bacterium]